MVSVTTTLALQADEGAVDSYLSNFGSLLLRQADAPGVYWLVLRRPPEPEDLYYARVAWSDYPDAPPSVRFHESIGGRHDVNSAWPAIPGFRVGSWDICQPFTAEGFQAHPDWIQSVHAWSSSGNPFLFVAEQLQEQLNHKCTGRNP